jgi:hypothetical protein
MPLRGTFFGHALRALCIIALFSAQCWGASFLFDASLEVTAGNADWVIDADYEFNQQSRAQRYPTPDDCEVGPGTHESFWFGAISAWGIDLAKAGHHVESLPMNTPITFGDPSNPQDLSHYDAFIIPEPQNRLRTSAVEAVTAFVAAGGGLFVIANHHGSDRNNNGADSTDVFNSFVDRWGFRFAQDDFYEPYNSNSADLPGDPVLHGPFGDVNHIEFHRASTIEIISNPPGVTLVPLFWRNQAPHGNSEITLLRVETSGGRIVAIGDSSPIDDGTGDPDDNLVNGYGTMRSLFMNAAVWIAEPEASNQFTPIPGATSTPSCPTPTPDYSPAPSPTPASDTVIVDIATNYSAYTAGNPFQLTLRIQNGPTTISADLYVILDVPAGDNHLYFFYPGWTESPDFDRKTLRPGMDETYIILDFTWPPDAGSGFATFWGAATRAASYEILDLDSLEFSWF